MFSFSTKLDVALGFVGLILHIRFLLVGIWKQGSLILFPTVHRHASARNGAAIEFVQHEPVCVRVVARGCGGTYFTSWVGGIAGGTLAAVVVAGNDAELLLEGFTDDGVLGAKNCPTPNNITSARTTTENILFVPFIIFT